ncbi:hypothetical protein PInf_019303 [Phytophthora infestans]|nr:hypothetical protein PInf_019303 [Phytophthora infestans]
MTPNYRWFWPLIGTATAAVVVYKYATRGVRNHGDSATQMLVGTQDSEDVDYEWLSEAEDDVEELLAMCGLMLMILVTVVSLVITWDSEDNGVSFMELPMFQPLMWIAVGIFTAARESRVPHDASDFELIRQHDAVHSAATTSRANGEDEEKENVPGDVAAVIKRADELFEQGQHTQTRQYLKAELPKYPPSAEMLWRVARACNYLVEEKSKLDEKKALAFEGLAHAEKAFALNSDSAASNKWMAIMTSTVGNFRDLKEKIAGAYVIRDHIQRAIELDPTDATSRNILGQWCLAFADMTWIEKRAAAALFGAPPSATYEEAVEHFHAAENISPGFWKKNVFSSHRPTLK